MGKIGKIWALLLVLLFLTSMMLLPSPIVKAQSRTLTVPDQYSNIPSAVGNASAGDTIFLKNGIYHLYGLNIDKPLHLIGQDSNNTVLMGYRGSRSNIPMLFIFSSDVSISSLSFSQCNIAIECNGKSLHDITIDSCSFFNNSGGVSITSQATIIVKNCLFENNMRALSLSGTHNIVSNNVIVSNDYGIDVSGDNTEIVGNIIVRNSFGVRLQSAVNVSVHGNQIANNVNRLNTTTQDGYGIQFDAVTNSTIVYDNILEGNNVGINLRNYLLVGTTVSYARGSDNFVFANNFINNTHKNANIEYQYPFAEAYSQLSQEVHPNSIINGTDIVAWDNDTIGNYWSDYKGNGSYVIDENNIDSHPLTQPAIILTASPTPNFPINGSWLQPLVIVFVIIATTIVFSFLLYRRHRKTANLK